MYTKGEWTVEHEFNVFSDNRLVAACGGYADNWKTEEVHNENKSNAHLIAAAPDMYEALKRFLDSSACTNGCDPDDMTCDTNFARRAINKAEGR
jgi:hypothetical protein